MERHEEYLLKSVNNALKVLDLLGVRDALSLTEISTILKLDKTSAFKLLYTLVHRGYVIKTAQAKYRLGVKFTDFGKLVDERQTTADIANEYLSQLSSATEQTVGLGMLTAAGTVVITHLVEGSDQNAIPSRIGYEMDAYCNANGKVLLAHLPKEQRDALLSNMHIVTRTPFTVENVEALQTELEEIPAMSLVTQVEEYRIGQADIAAPIFNHQRECRWAVSILCSTSNFRTYKDEYELLLTNAARRLSKAMGYTADS